MGNYKTNQIMHWGSMKCSDHNRTPLELNYESIENAKRMIRGTKRKYVVAKKRSWSTSWTNLPTNPAEVVDNGATGPMMNDFYVSNTAPFVLTLRDGAGNVTTAHVTIESFNYNVTKRGYQNDFWDVDVTLEEV